MDASFDLDQYQWKNRLLLVFAPSAKSPPYENQMRLLEGAGPELKDRDLKVLHLLLEGDNRIDDQALPPDAARQLRARFDVGEEAFILILIGKDGTEKRRDDAPLQPEALFEQIDAMPMRQRELQERKRGGEEERRKGSHERRD